MRIIDQYLHEVSARLPMKGRREIIEELQSLLLDEIENRYGPDAGEEEAKQILREFGPPYSVARRYSGHTQAIASGLTDLYFLILKIMLGAIAVAFVTVYVVELATGTFGDATLLGRSLQLPLQIANAFLVGTGVVTLGFIAVTRLAWNEGMDLQDDWTPEELSHVEIEPQTESRFSHIASISLSMVAIALFNLYPEVFVLVEEAVLLTGLELGHRLAIDVLGGYLVVISVVLAFEVAHHGASLRIGDGKPWLRLARTGITLMSVVLTAVMVWDMRLYTDYSGIIGFRLMFVIALGGNVIELVKQLVDYAKAKVAEAPSTELG